MPHLLEMIQKAALFAQQWIKVHKKRCKEGDLLKMKVNNLTSVKTQLPYSYYTLRYCKPDKIVDSAENLGEVLRGDRIENSPYKLFSIVAIQSRKEILLTFGMGCILLSALPLTLLACCLMLKIFESLFGINFSRGLSFFFTELIL